MKTTCPHCNNTFSVPLEFAGETVKCPKCKNAVETPALPTPPIIGYILACFISAALAGVIGFSCGALLTRTSREEIEAKIVAVQTVADLEIKKAHEKMLDAQEEIRQLQNELEQSEAEINELGRSVRKAVSEKQKLEGEVNQFEYEIVQREDLSYGGVIRTGYRIRVNKPVTEGKLHIICKELIQQQKLLKPHNAISFFFYLPGTNTSGHYTAGKADWSPYGKWEEADSVATGDYSKHKLVVEVGSALGAVPKSVKTNLSLTKRKKIFYDVVSGQDKSMGDIKAYFLIAKKYGIDVSVVKKIAVEGAISGWPMPPPP